MKEKDDCNIFLVETGFPSKGKEISKSKIKFDCIKYFVATIMFGTLFGLAIASPLNWGFRKDKDKEIWIQYRPPTGKIIMND